MTDDRFTSQERETLRRTSLGHESPALAGQLAARRQLALQGRTAAARHTGWRLAAGATAFSLVALLTLAIVWQQHADEAEQTAALSEPDAVADVDFYLWMNEQNQENGHAEDNRS